MAKQTKEQRAYEAAERAYRAAVTRRDKAVKHFDDAHAALLFAVDFLSAARERRHQAGRAADASQKAGAK